MTALAFLFAVFLARPCPFYVLDEVEAALDEHNLDRFLALLRRCATRAQFIVMTHQKRTMEAAELALRRLDGRDGASQGDLASPRAEPTERTVAEIERGAAWRGRARPRPSRPSCRRLRAASARPRPSHGRDEPLMVAAIDVREH